jgi:hypothetical protein
LMVYLYQYPFLPKSRYSSTEQNFKVSSKGG